MTGESPRVLVIDDDVPFAELVGMMFEQAGCTVKMVHSGAKAIQEAPAFNPHLILCDMLLDATMNGGDVSKALRSIPTLDRARLIALTGFSKDECEETFKDSRFDLLLTKPITLEKVEALVADL